MKNTELYEKDFAEWSALTAAAIRQGRWSEIDQSLLAEEIESMGRSDSRELKSKLTVLIGHLLKWQFQPEKRTPSWHTTIVIQRDDVADLLAESPSLRGKLDLSRVYERATVLASAETGLSGKWDFPRECPWVLEQILDAEYWPGDLNA